jgi:hypothetical protein
MTITTRGTIHQHITYSNDHVGHVDFCITFRFSPTQLHANVHVVHRTHLAGNIIHQRNIVNEYHQIPLGTNLKSICKNIKINVIPSENGFDYIFKWAIYAKQRPQGLVE